MKSIKIKRGQTVSLACTDNFPVGEWAITGQVRDRAGVKYADIVFTPALITSADVTVDRAFLMTIDETITKEFPVSTAASKLFCDFFYREAGDSINLVTETFQLDVEPNITDIPL